MLIRPYIVKPVIVAPSAGVWTYTGTYWCRTFTNKARNHHWMLHFTGYRVFTLGFSCWSQFPCIIRCVVDGKEPPHVNLIYFILLWLCYKLYNIYIWPSYSFLMRRDSWQCLKAVGHMKNRTNIYLKAGVKGQEIVTHRISPLVVIWLQSSCTLFSSNLSQSVTVI